VVIQNPLCVTVPSCHAMRCIAVGLKVHHGARDSTTFCCFDYDMVLKYAHEKASSFYIILRCI